MKVPVQDFKNAVSLFEANIIAGAQKSVNKFALGIAFAKASAGIDGMIKPFLDEGGMVDVDKLKAYIDAGLKASGGELKIEPQIDPALKLIGLSIKDITLTRTEFDDFFTKMIPAAMKPLKAVE